MRALAAELCERGTSVTHDTVWRFIRREGLSTTIGSTCSSAARISSPCRAGALGRMAVTTASSATIT